MSGQAAAFSPSDVSGLTLWLKSSAITGKSDGDLIDQWDDLSGNGYHATASGALRPTYKTNIENGKPAVLFSGAQYLASTQRNNLINNNNYAIFIAAKVADLSLAASQYFLSDLNTRLIMYTTSGGVLTGRHTYSGGSFDMSAGAGTDNAVFIFDMRHDEGYGGADVRRHQVKRSGGAVNGNFAVGPFVTTGGTDTVYLGGVSGLSRFLTGHMFEVIIYNSSVSDANRTNVRDYMATELGFVYS